MDKIIRLSGRLRKITDEIKNMHTQLDKLEFEFNNLPNNREGRRKEQKLKNKYEKIQKKVDQLMAEGRAIIDELKELGVK